MICKIHGTDCTKEGWFCPVCDLDRCRKCAYVFCSVDGRKKDPRCTFVCKLCDKRVGIDHRLKCDICNTEGCSKCIRTGAENKKICTECGFTCSSCGKINPVTQQLKCDVCGSLICTSCGLRSCSNCGVKVCRYDSYVCGQCGKNYCKQCMGGKDAINSQLLCPSCIHKCAFCGKTIGQINVQITQDTGKEMCLECTCRCSACDNPFYKGDIGRCTICREYVCKAHTATCPSCGSYVCKVHMFHCSTCGMDYCQRCRPKTDEPTCNLCSNTYPLKKGRALVFAKRHLRKLNIIPLVNWRYAEGSTVYIFFNSVALTSYIVVIDKKSGDILKVRRVNVFERIKNFLSR